MFPIEILFRNSAELAPQTTDFKFNTNNILRKTDEASSPIFKSFFNQFLFDSNILKQRILPYSPEAVALLPFAAKLSNANKESLIFNSRISVFRQPVLDFLNPALPKDRSLKNLEGILRCAPDQRIKQILDDLTPNQIKTFFLEMLRHPHLTNHDFVDRLVNIYGFANFAEFAIGTFSIEEFNILISSPFFAEKICAKNGKYFKFILIAISNSNHYAQQQLLRMPDFSRLTSKELKVALKAVHVQLENDWRFIADEQSMLRFLDHPEFCNIDDNTVSNFLRYAAMTKQNILREALIAHPRFREMKDPWLWIKIQSTFRAYISIEEADRLRQLPNFTMPNTIRRIFSEMVPGFAFGFFLIFLDQITDS